MGSSPMPGRRRWATLSRRSAFSAMACRWWPPTSGQMAPSGRIAVAALFQCGDEIRRIQRFAYRMALLRAPEARHRTGTGADSGSRIPRWQPLRQAIEKLLVTYDWGEAFVALNVCLKPMLDDCFCSSWPSSPIARGDHLDGQILRSLFEDCQWHRDWTEALLALATADRPDNRAVVARLGRRLGADGRGGRARSRRGPRDGTAVGAGRRRTSDEGGRPWLTEGRSRQPGGPAAFEQLADESLDGVWACDRELRCLYWNATMERLSESAGRARPRLRNRRGPVPDRRGRRNVRRSAPCSRGPDGSRPSNAPPCRR